MVLKPRSKLTAVRSLFENDVKMYGTQTGACCARLSTAFENDVKMYGTQTNAVRVPICRLFENDVKMYGTQTRCSTLQCLRAV